jgi:outer membrane receptor protein involved in Fe transport
MGYISRQPAHSSPASSTYNCRKAQGDAYTNCAPPYNSVQIQGFQTGNKNLKYITAKSWGYGAVWSPTNKFNIKVDYYNVKIDNEVNSYSLQTILDREADCRLGHTRSGTPVDGTAGLPAVYRRSRPQSGQCMIGAGQLNTVSTFPINISNETVAGITAACSIVSKPAVSGDFRLAPTTPRR